MHFGVPILLGCLGLAAPVPGPPRNLSEALFHALCASESRDLKPFLVPPPYEEYAETTPAIEFLPSSRGQVIKRLPKEEYNRRLPEWTLDAERSAERSLMATRSFGVAVGFTWSAARLQAVRIHALNGPGFPYDPVKDTKTLGTHLALVLSDGKKEMTVFVPIQGIRRGPRPLGAWITTDLTAEERQTFGDWRLGRDDEAVARLIAHRLVSKDYFILNGFIGGIHRGGNSALTVRLPAVFDKTKPDKIELLESPFKLSSDAPAQPITLTETGNDTLSFEGLIPVTFLDGVKFPFSLSLDRRDGPEFVRQRKWRARDSDSGDVEFFQIPNQPRTFRCRKVETIRYGAGGAGSAGRVDITFVDGIARTIRTVPKSE